LKFVPYELRKACAFIGQVLSSEIARREVEEESQYQARATITEAKFLELMAGSSTTLLGLVHLTPGENATNGLVTERAWLPKKSSPALDAAQKP
jgi:light-regulated signal transduction histidine kinase (bacteriophytochrome)